MNFSPIENTPNLVTFLSRLKSVTFDITIRYALQWLPLQKRMSNLALVFLRYVIYIHPTTTPLRNLNKLVNSSYTNTNQPTPDTTIPRNNMFYTLQNLETVKAKNHSSCFKWSRVFTPFY